MSSGCIQVFTYSANAGLAEVLGTTKRGEITLLVPYPRLQLLTTLLRHRERDMLYRKCAKR